MFALGDISLLSTGFGVVQSVEYMYKWQTCVIMIKRVKIFGAINKANRMFN